MVSVVSAGHFGIFAGDQLDKSKSAYPEGVDKGEPAWVAFDRQVNPYHFTMLFSTLMHFIYRY